MNRKTYNLRRPVSSLLASVCFEELKRRSLVKSCREVIGGQGRTNINKNNTKEILV